MHQPDLQLEEAVSGQRRSRRRHCNQSRGCRGLPLERLVCCLQLRVVCLQNTSGTSQMPASDLMKWPYCLSQQAVTLLRPVRAQSDTGSARCSVVNQSSYIDKWKMSLCEKEQGKCTCSALMLASTRRARSEPGVLATGSACEAPLPASADAAAAAAGRSAVSATRGAAWSAGCKAAGDAAPAPPLLAGRFGASAAGAAAASASSSCRTSATAGLGSAARSAQCRGACQQDALQFEASHGLRPSHLGMTVSCACTADE